MAINNKTTNDKPSIRLNTLKAFDIMNPFDDDFQED
jgi:hypothetical protein